MGLGEWFRDSARNHYDYNDHHHYDYDRASDHSSTNDSGPNNHSSFSTHYLAFSGVGLGLMPIDWHFR